MEDLRIFISYTHDDAPIATPLSNLLQAAFGPALAEVFLDRSCITFGATIKESVTCALTRADILIAVIAGGQPASALSWPGFEVGTFSAYWADDHYKQGPHKDREKQGIIGAVVVLANTDVAMGPQQGHRAVNLGISDQRLSDAQTPERLQRSREAASVENGEVLELLREIETNVRGEPDYDRFARKRDKTLAELAKGFKLEAFDALRNRVRNRSKPTKQLIIRNSGTGPSLGDDVRVVSVAGASEVFGKVEGDARLFKKTDEGHPGSEHFEASWGEFKASVKDHPYGAYWCGVIEHAVVGATREGPELDPNLVLISHRGHRYRVIATTVTTYFNNDSEVSLYLIEALQRRDRGDEETSKLLNLLIIVCRFRFAFLEDNSPYYWRNFGGSIESPKDLLMELDYLKSEAMNAGLEQVGIYEKFMGAKRLEEMLKIWNEVDLQLRKACNAAITEGAAFGSAPKLTAQIVVELRRIADEVKPFNTHLGAAVAAAMATVFNERREAEHPPDKESTPAKA